jgi:hypothetical protein
MLEFSWDSSRLLCLGCPIVAFRNVFEQTSTTFYDDQRGIDPSRAIGSILISLTRFSYRNGPALGWRDVYRISSKKTIVVKKKGCGFAGVVAYNAFVGRAAVARKKQYREAEKADSIHDTKMGFNS